MISDAEKALNSSIWFRDRLLTVEDYMQIKDTITKECRWFLIGDICERAKHHREDGELIETLLRRLGQRFGCSNPAIRRFVGYSKAINRLYLAAPDIVDEVIAGVLSLSPENLINLSRRQDQDLRKTAERVKAGKEALCIIFPERAIKPTKDSQHNGEKAAVTVKDIPEYDPDAQVSGLIYTIPSWISAIERVLMGGNIQLISEQAKKRLAKELYALKESVDSMVKGLTEKRHKMG